MSRMTVRTKTSAFGNMEVFGDLVPGSVFAYAGELYAKLDLHWPATEDEYDAAKGPPTYGFIRNAVNLTTWRLWSFCNEEEVETVDDLPREIV